jgi:hypothetical protein
VRQRDFFLVQIVQEKLPKVSVVIRVPVPNSKGLSLVPNSAKLVDGKVSVSVGSAPRKLLLRVFSSSLEFNLSRYQKSPLFFEGIFCLL